jgi:DNA-binding NarL/FixJ family response regulator
VGGLSDREVEVLRLLARGLSNKQIAERLTISKETVNHHIRHIYNKIDVSTRAAATLFAMQHNLVHDVGDPSPAGA